MEATGWTCARRNSDHPIWLFDQPQQGLRGSVQLRCDYYPGLSGAPRSWFYGIMVTDYTRGVVHLINDRFNSLDAAQAAVAQRLALVLEHPRPYCADQQERNAAAAELQQWATIAGGPAGVAV